MHILITGGSGFLGSALTERLRREGADVTWLSRRASTPAPDGVEVRTYSQLWADDRFDAVVNLAGAGIADRRWSDARKQQLQDSRLIPTRVLTDWIRAAHVPPKVLLSGSAVGWYGAQGEVPLDEDSPPHDEFQHRLCADWEAAARVVEDRVPVVRLRTGVVLHPAGGMLQRLRLPFALGLGARAGAGPGRHGHAARRRPARPACAAAGARVRLRVAAARTVSGIRTALTSVSGSAVRARRRSLAREEALRTSAGHAHSRP